MGTKIIQDQINVIQITAPSGGVTVDTPLFVNDAFVMPLATAAAGEEVSVQFQGVVTLPKATPLAITLGDNLYWSGSAVTKTATDRFIGKASAAAGSSATTVSVVMTPGAQGDADLADHLADTSAAHAASAISIADAGGLLTATDVEGAVAEIAGEVDAHVADTSAAHAASAISIADAGALYGQSDVEGALAEAASLYVLSFAGAASAGNIDVGSACKTTGVTPAAGDKVLAIIGYVTATGAVVGAATTGGTDFAGSLIDASGVKLQQISASNLSANTYVALCRRVIAAA